MRHAEVREPVGREARVEWQGVEEVRALRQRRGQTQRKRQVREQHRVIQWQDAQGTSQIEGAECDAAYARSLTQQQGRDQKSADAKEKIDSRWALAPNPG